MFKIIQSHRTEILVEHLLEQYRSDELEVFEPFVVIVPSMILGDWLDKQIASQTGISTLVMTKFWGQYQWILMQDVLDCHNNQLLVENPNATTLNVPEVAVLSTTVMQWRLFGYLTFYREAILADESHALYPLLNTLLGSLSDNTDEVSSDTQKDDQHQAQAQSLQAQQDARLWQLANDLARVFNRYLTHREDWLAKWSRGETLDVEVMIKDKDELSRQFDKYARDTPEFLMAHYIELEQAQRHLWVNLFASVHQYRVSLEEQFWQALKQNKYGERKVLPKMLRIFTIQQLPQAELDFLHRLSKYMHITLLHYNPSKLFWADIVDKSWLQRQQIINPQNVFLRDYGHSLLSRLGKQSRDMFAMLANLSGNEEGDSDADRVVWIDDFGKPYEGQNAQNVQNAQAGVEVQSDESSLNQNSPSLLQRLQDDVLMLDEQGTQDAMKVKAMQAVSQEIDADTDSTKNGEWYDDNWYDDEVLKNKRFEKQRDWSIATQDNSLSIHSCHSLQRQLEVLRIMIGRWLSEDTGSEKKRHISDIVVLLPDVERHYALINSIFVNGEGQDGLTLPAKVTGVVDTSIRQLWEAIIGFYKLLGSDSARFEASEVLDWLMLPPLYENFGLTHEQMSRGCELLIEAGFIRGFDEAHLKQTLDSTDYDYRFSFAHALDRLTLGLVMPEARASNCLYPLTADEADIQSSNQNSFAIESRSIGARATEVMTTGDISELTLPVPQVSLNDAPIIDTLCRIYMGLVAHRDDHKKSQTAEEWLNQIESEVIHRYFGAVDQTRSMRAIYNAMNGFKSSLRANRHYKQYSNQPNSNQPSKTIEHTLSNVEALTFRLSFMLDSIEVELESQQVSAEPTGVITFGRFGALRNVPFELVVMLNMNLSEFPAHDRDNRYDLMKATLSRRGDRVTEDDDNGAFLDALLCARSACWIFYNGKSLTDDNDHLPANPVSELLQFLQGEVTLGIDPLKEVADQYGTTDNGLTDDLTNGLYNSEANEEIIETTQAIATLNEYLPKLTKDFLVTEHPALPFHESLFLSRKNDVSHNHNDKEDDEFGRQLNEAMRKAKIKQRQQYPPAPLWQMVYQQLTDDDKIQQLPVVQLPSKAQYKTIADIFTNDNQKYAVTINDTDTNEVSDINEVLSINEVLGGQLAQSLTKIMPTGQTTAQLFDSLFNITEIVIDKLTYQVRHPAKAFLREQQVHILQGEEALAHQEPLALDNLTAYKLKDYLINELVASTKSEDANNSNATPKTSDKNALLLYQNLIPAGVARQTTLPNQQQKLRQQCAEFHQLLLRENLIASDDKSNKTINELSLLTPTDEDAIRIDIQEVLSVITKCIEEDNENDLQITLNSDVLTYLATAIGTIKVKGDIPSAQSSLKAWFNLLPNSASPKHLLKFWLSHVYWQVARRTTAEQVATNDGISVWRYNKPRAGIKKFEKIQTFQLKPIPYEIAVLELIKWAIYGKLAGQVPMTLLPDYALNFIDKTQTAQAEEDTATYRPNRGDFTDWLYPSFQANGVYDTCVQHAIWQYILPDSDTFNAFKALTDSLSTLAMPLYQNMYQALIPIKE